MGLRILVVEDEQIVAADLAAKVTRMGYELVGSASSGEEAIALADAERPDIVFMDIRLRGQMTGIEAAKAIQQKTAAKVIFITAYAAVFLRDPALMQGTGICLSKPFSQYQLRAALDAVINKPYVQ